MMVFIPVAHLVWVPLQGGIEWHRFGGTVWEVSRDKKANAIPRFIATAEWTSLRSNQRFNCEFAVLGPLDIRQESTRPRRRRDAQS